MPFARQCRTRLRPCCSASIRRGYLLAAGAVYGVLYPFNPGSHYDLISRLLSIVVLGGLGSLGGAVLAALAMGVVEAVVAVEISPTWAAFSFFIVLIAFLVVRPQGMFGLRERTL